MPWDAPMDKTKKKNAGMSTPNMDLMESLTRAERRELRSGAAGKKDSR